MLGPHGPLGTASARINLAHSLTWIAKTTAQDLLLLKNLRNESAHEPHTPESMQELFRSRMVNHKLLRRFTSAYFEDLAWTGRGDSHRALSTNRSQAVPW